MKRPLVLELDELFFVGMIELSQHRTLSAMIWSKDQELEAVAKQIIDKLRTKRLKKLRKNERSFRCRTSR